MSSCPGIGASSTSETVRRLDCYIYILRAITPRSSPDANLDDTGDAVLLAGDEDTTGILCVVAAVSLVDIGPLDRTAGEWLGRNISFDPVVLCFFDRIVVSLRRGPPCAVRWR